MLKLLALAFALIVGQSYARAVHSTLLATASNKLNLDLLQHLYDDQKNVFFSPFSISTVFGMLFAGAKGMTLEEMRQVLGYNLVNLLDEQIVQEFSHVLKDMNRSDSKKYELSVANKLVVQKDFDILKSYQTLLQNYFNSSIESVNFADRSVANHINSWVSSVTHDKIKSLFDGPLPESTRLVLLNAIYFKGLFQTKFLKNATQEDVFFNGGNVENKTQMMRREGKFNFTEVAELDSKLLEIPYTGDDISLYIVLPNNRQGLKNLNKVMYSWIEFESHINNLKEQVVQVTIPKFKIETKYSLKDKLSEMGMKSVFTPSADLSGIDGKRDLEVSDVIHKAFVEVNEEGTEAAAVTAIVIVKTSSITPHKPKPVFKADHPFMFFIRNNRNGMVLFTGYVNQM